jgi:DNA-binding MarR family transcriptional regulator
MGGKDGHMGGKDGHMGGKDGHMGGKDGAGVAKVAMGGAAAAAEALYALMVAMVRQQPRDMSLTASSTLGTVVRMGPCRVTDLAVLEAVAQPSMTALVSGLERAGLVERRTSASDQRVVLVAPTPAGESYVQARSRMWSETFLPVIEKLPELERRALCGAAPALQHLVELYDEHRANGERPTGPDRSPELSQPSPRAV